MIRRTLAVVALSAVTTSCLTVNIYFPAPEVRQAAEQIVEETWGQNSAAPTPGADAGSSGARAAGLSRLARILDALAPAEAAAQDVDINVSTASIRTIKESMRARADQLKAHLAAGRVGVGRDGMLVVRNLDGIDLKDQASVRRLVEAENRDRLSLYGEIAKANNFGSERVEDIKKIFAEVWVEKAEKGWPIQKADGGWGVK